MIKPSLRLPGYELSPSSELISSEVHVCAVDDVKVPYL